MVAPPDDASQKTTLKQRGGKTRQRTATRCTSDTTRQARHSPLPVRPLLPCLRAHARMTPPSARMPIATTLHPAKATARGNGTSPQRLPLRRTMLQSVPHTSTLRTRTDRARRKATSPQLAYALQRRTTSVVRVGHPGESDGMSATRARRAPNPSGSRKSPLLTAPPSAVTGWCTSLRIRTCRTWAVGWIPPTSAPHASTLPPSGTPQTIAARAIHCSRPVRLLCLPPRRPRLLLLPTHQ